MFETSSFASTPRGEFAFSAGDCVDSWRQHQRIGRLEGRAADGCLSADFTAPCSRRRLGKVTLLYVSHLGFVLPINWETMSAHALIESERVGVACRAARQRMSPCERRGELVVGAGSSSRRCACAARRLAAGASHFGRGAVRAGIAAVRATFASTLEPGSLCPRRRYSCRCYSPCRSPGAPLVALGLALGMAPVIVRRRCCRSAADGAGQQLVRLGTAVVLLLPTTEPGRSLGDPGARAGGPARLRFRANAIRERFSGALRCGSWPGRWDRSIASIWRFPARACASPLPPWGARGRCFDRAVVRGPDGSSPGAQRPSGAVGRAQRRLSRHRPRSWRRGRGRRHLYRRALQGSRSLASMSPRARLNVDERRNVEFAALLHDIGKIAVPKEIVNKAGHLDDGEWAIIRTHTLEGQTDAGARRRVYVRIGRDRPLLP